VARKRGKKEGGKQVICKRPKSLYSAVEQLDKEMSQACVVADDITIAVDTNNYPLLQNRVKQWDKVIARVNKAIQRCQDMINSLRQENGL